MTSRAFGRKRWRLLPCYALHRNANTSYCNVQRRGGCCKGAPSAYRELLNVVAKSY